MRNGVITTVRVIIGLCLAGSLVVQTVIAPLLWADLEAAAPWERAAVVAIVVLGVLALQITAVCVWRLLSLVARGSIFSPRAFPPVDVSTGAVAAVAVLTFAFAAVLAPGDAAPGMVAIVCGISLATAGVALVIVVLRTVLARAIAQDAELRGLRARLADAA